MNQNVQVNTVKPELSFFENDVLNRLLNFDRELLLDSKSEEVENFMKNNPGHGLSEEVKDVLYGNAQNLYNEYKNQKYWNSFCSISNYFSCKSNYIKEYLWFNFRKTFFNIYSCLLVNE